MPTSITSIFIVLVVAKEGGISRAANKLDMAVQTISAQVRELERSMEPHLRLLCNEGEFEDSALLKTFSASGMGVFPTVEWVHEDLLARNGVR